jgi:hypothetical protein
MAKKATVQKSEVAPEYAPTISVPSGLVFEHFGPDGTRSNHIPLSNGDNAFTYQGKIDVRQGMLLALDCDDDWQIIAATKENWDTLMDFLAANRPK